MSYRYNGNDILAPASTDGSANTLFNYKISGVDAKYLKPFCTSTTTTEHNVLCDIPRFYANALNYKYNLVLDLSFCPKYTLHTSSQSGVTVPTGVTTMFVVCIGGGGGGGGGGVISGPDNNGGAGGGGGGGALKGWFVQSVGSTYDVTIGNGGAFGRPSGNTTVGEGMTSLGGSSGSGSAGGNGSATSFVYNGTTYSSPGGSGGSGGSTVTVNGGTGGTSGGTGGGTPTPFIWKDGNDGNKGFRFNAINNYSGGNGGGSGNYTGTNSSLHINKKLVNIEKIKNRSTDEITYQNTYEPTYNEYNIAQCEYGNGGRGGRGEAPSNWAWAGYSGNPGCAIVFFYYNNISTGAPLVTTVTTTSTHTLNASTTAFKIIVVGGGGGGQAGVQYDGANKGACGGGGASGTSVVAFTKNIPTNKQLSITIGAGGLRGGRTGWDTSTSYQYPLSDPTDGGSTKVTWNSASISIEAYGGNQAGNWGGISGAGEFGGVGGAISNDSPLISPSGVQIILLNSSMGIAGSTGSNESAGTNGVGGAGGSTIDLSAHLSEYGPAITSLGTYGYGGNGGKGEASNVDNPDGASPGSDGSSGVVIIIEY
jgi:hypothetical protein